MPNTATVPQLPDYRGSHSSMEYVAKMMKIAKKGGVVPETPSKVALGKILEAYTDPKPPEAAQRTSDPQRR